MTNQKGRPPAIGLQLWTIRHELELDADRALAAVKAAGFSVVELAPLPPGLTAAHLVESLKRHELTVRSIHCGLPSPDIVRSLADLASQCECSKFIWHGWPRDERFDSLAGVRELADVCNSANALMRDHRLGFGMHNHWWEFERVEGVQPISILHERLDESIFWQLDVYWAQTAGVDPAQAIAALSPRVESIHWKDGPCVHGEPMTSLGQGNIDVRRILEATRGPTDWIVELDECATDPLEAARQSLIYLESVSH